MAERRNIRWAWFQLTLQERLFMAAVVAIALVGLATRSWHQAHQQSTPYPLPPAEQAAYDTNY